MLRCSALCVIGGMILSPLSARGDTSSAVLDQSFTTATHIDNLTAVISSNYEFVGQTLTPGISGELVRAEMKILRIDTSQRNWEVTVREFPSGNVLATEIVGASIIPVSSPNPIPLTSVVFDPAPVITAGETIALVVRLEGLIAGSRPIEGRWNGHFSEQTNLGYTGGQAIASNDGTSYDTQPQNDLFFRTFVVVPEPTWLGAALMMGMSLIGVPLRPRR